MIRLRPAGEADSAAVLRWANDPTTRAASFTSRPIEPEEHARWFAASLDPDTPRRLFIVELDGQAAGLLRFQLADPRAEVGINLAPERRGRGFGVATLVAGSALALELGLTRLVAHIRPANQASRNAFERAGYTLVGPAKVSGQPALRYELELLAAGATASPP